MNAGGPGNAPPNEGKKSYLPSRKVGAGALAGALSVLVVWIINTFVLTGPTKITGEVASAITTILTFVVGYFIPEPA
ncbi:MAG TPA: hypothetical protein VH137_10880 [Gemmatimonadales bacterium]|nr:hypothetical protein [Gemmatimonadales bacterium]